MKNEFALVAALWLAAVPLLSQTGRPASQEASAGKGVTPVKSTGSVPGQTRAVVIGISDYQDDAIPDLRFADRDAEAFAAFLRSAAGPKASGLDGDHLLLLTNDKATAGRVAVALDWLIGQTGPNDHAIIYFSGHSDVEQNTISQPGFLLCWDSPARVYMGGGTFSLAYLQEVVTTLSVQNRAHVTVIADACHAGKLAGSQIGGSQISAAALARQYANETKVLSCQPTEFSIEGEQWGGGRGCFSYHLVDGLFGMADLNGDSIVSLLEMGRYLEDHVAAEAAPHAQTPLVLGNRVEALSRVVPGLLDTLRKFRAGQLPQFLPSSGRSIDELPYMNADSGILALQTAFDAAVARKAFFAPTDSCADLFYKKIMDSGAAKAYKDLLTRNYAAMLQDDAQQAVNNMMRMDVQEVTKSNLERARKFADYPKMLARAAELLGVGHYLYPVLKARQALFEGQLLYFETYSARNSADGPPVLEKCRRALALDPGLAAAHYYMAIVFSRIMDEPDSAILHANKAVRLAQTWVLPLAHTGFNLARYNRRFAESKLMLDRALAIDSTSAVVWTGIGAWHFFQEQYDEAAAAYRRVVGADPGNALAWANLGASLMGSTEHFPEAEAALHEALRLNPRQTAGRYFLASLFHRTGRDREAEATYLQALETNPRHLPSRDSLARIYLSQGRPREAEAQLLEMTKIRPSLGGAWFELACLAAADGRAADGLAFLEKAIENGRDDYEAIERDPRLTPVRILDGYSTLMKKHFPGRVRD